MDWQLATHLQDTINVKQVTATDGSGDETLGSATEVSARVVETTELIISFSGDEIRTTHSILTESEINYASRIWLPGDDDTDATLSRRPQKIEEGKDELGTTTHYITWV